MPAAQRKIRTQHEEPQLRPVRKVKHRIKSRPKAELNSALRNACIIMFLITAALAGVFTWRSGVAATQAYHLNQIKSQAKAVEAENARLHLEIAHLKSPERIQAIASQQLGMILPDKFFFSTKK